MDHLLGDKTDDFSIPVRASFQPRARAGRIFHTCTVEVAARLRDAKRLHEIFEFFREACALGDANFELVDHRDATLSASAYPVRSACNSSQRVYTRERTSTFYIGKFAWGGDTYVGTHKPIITGELFECTQDVMNGRNKRKCRKHDFAFRGLLTCAEDNCTMTAEIQKGKYSSAVSISVPHVTTRLLPIFAHFQLAGCSITAATMATTTITS